MKKKPAICLFGVGNVGLALLNRLLMNQYTVRIWNRSIENIARHISNHLLDDRCVATGTLNEIIQEHTVLIMSVSDYTAVQEILFDADWAHMLAGKTIINVTTISAYRSAGMETAFHAHDAHYIELAIYGTIAEINAGKVLAFVGCAENVYKRTKNLITAISANAQFIGEPRDAVTFNLALQQLTIGMLTTFINSISIIKQQNLTTDQFMQIVRSLPMYSALFDQKLDRLINRDYEQPSQKTECMLRIMEMFLEDANELKLNSATAEVTKDLLGLAKAKGQGKFDFLAINDVIHPPRED